MNEQRNPSSRWPAFWDTYKGHLAVVFGTSTALLVVVAVIQSLDLQRKYPWVSWGTVPESFAAVGTVAAVAVALWQSVVIRKQAEADGAAAAHQFQIELEAATERHQIELEAAAERHQIELDHQRELAREQRIHLSEQQQKVALAEVSRAVDAHAHTLARLWSRGAKILKIEDPEIRLEQLDALSEECSLAAKSAVQEVVMAQMLVQHDQLHDALDRVIEAIEAGVYTEMAVRESIAARVPPRPNPIPDVQALMSDRTAATWRLAAELLVTGIAE